MKRHAYVLAGDPAWARHSVSSYYDLVDRIVVSYDQDGLSWSGRPLAVEESLAALRSIDHDGKMLFLPGAHSAPERPALDAETTQRQGALDVASEGAQWVLQLDTDEVVLDQRAFVAALDDADAQGFDSVHYPMRDFYQRAERDAVWDDGGGRFLEHCSRWWGPQAAYPGPLALRVPSILALCRQTNEKPYRADFGPVNTDPAHPMSAPVHRVVGEAEAVAHMSWVRSPEQMLRKSQTSGHAAERNWGPPLRRWARRGRHPWLTAASAPLHREAFERFRVARLELPAPR